MKQENTSCTERVHYRGDTLTQQSSGKAAAKQVVNSENRKKRKKRTCLLAPSHERMPGIPSHWEEEHAGSDFQEGNAKPLNPRDSSMDWGFPCVGSNEEIPTAHIYQEVQYLRLTHLIRYSTLHVWHL